MAYQLKTIRYQEKDHFILLQNENGPCPLLAAANCLILKGTIALPSNCIGAGVVTIDQLGNVLAEKILSHNSSGQVDHHVQEVLTIFPSLQFGMDVNPKFTAGPTGVEYTMHLNAFDLLHIELVHGWLLEPDTEEYEIIGSRTYNQLVNMVIEGNDAATTLQNAKPTDPPMPEDHHDALSTKATQGVIVQNFLDRSGHQLTQYGLDILYDHMKEGQLVVFFRNNHFNTLTKHEGLLYLLVTDLGYANVSTVIWEKLDVIDGDTEYVNAQFSTSKAPTTLSSASTSNDPQSRADYQLALQLSQENSHSAPSQEVRLAPPPTPGRVQAMSHRDLELEAAQRASVEEYNRLNPDNPIPIDIPQTNNSRSESASSFGEQMAFFTERMRQAGTSIGTSFQEVVSSAANGIQPAGFHGQTTGSGHEQSSSTTTLEQPSQPALLHQPHQHQHPQEQTMVAMGIPAEMSSQEAQDRMLALQLQREEENARALLNSHMAADQTLAEAMGRQGHVREERFASRPGATLSPAAIRTTSVRHQHSGVNEKCVIS